VRYIVLFLLLILLFPNASRANEIEFGEWYGVYENGRKQIVCFSGSNTVTLTVYVDYQQITRLSFNPEKEVRIATFDDKIYRGMNYHSLYGYDHWIRKMIKHRFLRVWFKGEKECEVFPLKGLSKAVNWLQSK
jgi:hypothetical protein